MSRPRRLIIGLLAGSACLGALSLLYVSRAAAESLPARLTDKAFWQLVEDLSEPNGYFRSDNFLSNELGFQQVIPELQRVVPVGGVYVGVGPEQNFTYLAALRPKMAFIVDIRRGNLHEQLLYKAFFELSSDRADFLSKLFARPRPEGLPATATVDQLFEAFGTAKASEDLFTRNLEAAKRHLVTRHGFALSEDDLNGLAYVYDAFYQAGPDLNYAFLNRQFSGGGFGGGFFPTYADLMTATDGRGAERSYLSSDEAFRTVSELEKSNLIVPIVGDFGGPKAIRGVGRYLHDHGATVGAFYTSNVEMYLFQSDAWRRFYASVATMPVDARSTFIRSVSNRGYAARNASNGVRSTSRLSSVADLLAAFAGAKIQGYYDVIAMSR